MELNDITDHLESSAAWRRDKAAQFPDDTRNEKAAEILERLLKAVQGLSESFLFRKLQRAEDELVCLSDGNQAYDLCGLSEEISQYHRDIGFHSEPSSGDEYIKGLLEIYQSQIMKAKEAIAREKVRATSR